MNNYIFTKDKTVLLCESSINDEFDKHISTYNHAPVGIRRVNDTDIVTIMTGTGKQGTTNRHKLDSFPCTHCGKLYKNWESLFRHMDTTTCSMSRLRYQTNMVSGGDVNPTTQTELSHNKDNQLEEYVEYDNEEQKPEIIHITESDDDTKETEVDGDRINEYKVEIKGKEEVNNEYAEYKDEEQKPEIIEIIDSDDNTKETEVK